MSFVSLDNSKREEGVYEDVIKKIEDDGLCPFCLENLKKYHKNPILEENDSWLATKNMYPYKGTRCHLIFIHKEHISKIDEVSPKSWLELQEIVVSMTKRFKIKGGATFIRFGDTRFTGASVSHLHAHLVSPRLGNREPILTRIG